MRSEKLLWTAWFFWAISVLVKFIHTAAFLLSNGTLPNSFSLITFLVDFVCIHAIMPVIHLVYVIYLLLMYTLVLKDLPPFKFL